MLQQEIVITLVLVILIVSLIAWLVLELINSLRRVTFTKAQFISKQQLEIEELKEELEQAYKRMNRARGRAIGVQQWDPKAQRFPSVAMNACILIAQELD